MAKKKNKEKRKKIPEIFNYTEKKKFIQTLLIVGGLITVFNRGTNNIISLFTLFIVSSLCYIIWISILEKTDDETEKRAIHLGE